MISLLSKGLSRVFSGTMYIPTMDPNGHVETSHVEPTSQPHGHSPQRGRGLLSEVGVILRWPSEVLAHEKLASWVTPRNTKATDIPHAPYTGFQRIQQREQVEGRMFTGVQPYLGPNYLEIKPGGAKVSQLGHPGESVGGEGNPARD